MKNIVVRSGEAFEGAGWAFQSAGLDLRSPLTELEMEVCQGFKRTSHLAVWTLKGVGRVSDEAGMAVKGAGV